MIDRLTSNGYELNLSDGISTPILFSIADFREPDKRQRDISKEIKLLGTATNLLFFSGTFSFHVNDTEISFDATAKTPAKFYKRGVEIMPNAVIKLKSVEFVKNNYIFNIQLFSESVDIFLLLSKINVNELDWSEYQYTLSRTAIKDSWLTPIGSGYKYPLIEYRQRAGTLIWNTTDLVPYVFLREVFVKMMQYVNVDFDSDFIDSDRFKSILYGFGGGEVTATLNLADQLARRVELDAISFDYSTSLTMSGTSNYYTFFNEINFNNQICTALTETTDALDQFDQSTVANTFTIARTGSYNLNIQGVLNATVTDLPFPASPVDVYRFGSPTLKVLKNGVIIQTQSYSDEFFVTTRNYTINLNAPLSCQVGDVITIIISGVTVETQQGYLDGGNTLVGLTITDTTPLTMDLTAVDGSVTDGSIVDLWRYIPSQKCSEVFSSIIKMFNLYYDNPDINGVVSIKPVIDYYSLTNDFEDITQLVDYNKPVLFTPMGNGYGKEVKFKFKECKDTDATNYLDEFGKRYNDYEFTQGSYYAKGEQVTQINFATIVPFQISTGILIPRLCKIENTGLVKLQKGEPRVMMWNGMKSGTWTLRNTDNTALSEVLTEYPCVHHFDDWQDPEFDLSFQLVDELQYDASFVTSANLFSVYHYQSVNEIISPSAQLLTLYLKLTADDVKNMTFSKLKMINGALFKLNLLGDFDPNITESTRVELIKVLDATRKKKIKYSFPSEYVPEAVERTLEGTVTQTGTVAPSVTAFQTTGGGLSFVTGRYNGTGDYTLIFEDNTFIDNVGLVLISGDANGYVSNHNEVTIETSGNNKLNNTSILIKTYI